MKPKCYAEYYNLDILVISFSKCYCVNCRYSNSRGAMTEA